MKSYRERFAITYEAERGVEPRGREFALAMTMNVAARGDEEASLAAQRILLDALYPASDAAHDRRVERREAQKRQRAVDLHMLPIEPGSVTLGMVRRSRGRR